VADRRRSGRFAVIWWLTWPVGARIRHDFGVPAAPAQVRYLLQRHRVRALVPGGDSHGGRGPDL